VNVPDFFWQIGRIDPINPFCPLARATERTGHLLLRIITFPKMANLWHGSMKFAGRERVRPVWLQGFDGSGKTRVCRSRRNAADEPV
jgi:hypothetical protein